MNIEQNKCNFCGEIKPVLRQYVRVKNKHFDDNKQGKYSDFFYYCNDCGVEVSDGYHTFNELYEHRIRLFIQLCKAFYNDPQYQTGQKAKIWCSVLHSDGSKYEDWFILGIGKEKGEQITYHLPVRFWNEVCEFAQVLEKSPEWDGHTSNDVLERLKQL